MRDYTDIVEKSKRRKEKDVGTTTSSSTMYDATPIVERMQLEQSINFDTFTTEFDKVNQTVHGAYNGWQAQDYMASTIDTVKEMRNRLALVRKYKNKYAQDWDFDVDSAIDYYEKAIEGWGDQTELYKGYQNADAFGKAKKKAQFDYQFSKKDDKGEVVGGYTYDEVQEALKQYEEGSDEYQYLSGYTNYSNLNDYDKAINILTERVNATKPQPKVDHYGVPLPQPTAPKEPTKKSDDELLLEKLKIARNKYRLENGAYDYYSHYAEAEDFEEKSNFESTKVDGYWNVFTAEAGYKDFAHDYIKASETEEGLKTILNEYATYNGTNKSDAEKKGYHKLEPEERQLYYYLYNTDKEKAKKYLDDMEVTLSKRMSDDDAIADKQFATKHPILSSALSIPMNLYGAVEGVAYDVSNAIKGKEQNPFGYGHSMSNSAQNIRKEVGENIAENTDLEVLGVNVPSFLYQTGMSIGDTLVGGATIGSWYSVVAGSSAFQQKAKELKEAGENNDVVFANALASGTAETLFEYISIDKLLKIKNVDGGKKLFTQVLKQMGIEGSEELLTELANIGAEAIFRGDNSQLAQYKQELIERGYSEEEANKQVWTRALRQVGEAFAGGVLSGFGLGMGSSSINYQQNKSKGKSIRANAQTEGVWDMSAMTPEESETYKLYTEYANKGINAGDIKDAQLGNLYNTAEAESIEKLKSKKSTEDDRLNAVNTLSKLDKLSTPKTEEQKKREARVESLNKGEVTEVTATGNSTKIEGIKKVDGDLVVATSEGEFKADEVTFSQNDAELLSYAENMNEDMANLFVSQYDGSASVDAYNDSFNLAVSYAENNISHDTMLENRGVLTPDQVGTIYTSIVTNKTKAQRNAIAKLVEKHGKTMSYKGTINDSVIDYDNKTTDGSKVNWNSLTDSQRKGVTFLTGLAKATGLDAELITDGLEREFNGAYKVENGKIIIDVYAGVNKFDMSSDAKDTIIPALSHEISHWSKAKSPEKYQSLSDDIFKVLTKGGKSEVQLINEEVVRLRSRGIDADVEYARDEIIARACEDMLALSETGKEMFNSLSESERKSLLDKVKDIINDFVNWVNELLTHYQSKSKEATYLRQYKEDLLEISKQWDAMFKESIEVNQAMKKEGITDEAIINETLETIGLHYDAKTETVYHSYRSLEELFNMDDANDFIKTKNEYIDALVKATGKTKKECTNYLNSLFLVHDMIGDDRARLDYESAINKSAWVSNSEYGGSIDFSTLCAKRRLFTGTMDAIIEQLPNTVLTDTDFLDIRNRLLADELESPCSMCYVEGSRAKNSEYINKWLTEYKKTNPEWIPQLADFTSTVRLEQTRLQHPEAYKSYQDAMNKLSQRKPKEASVRTDYKGEIRIEFKDGTSVDIKNKNGGIRFNSFSDFEIIHALDCMQVVTDMATVGLAGQGYTKVKEFAECFGNTGMKINLSLVAKGVDVNGNLIFDEVNGMKYKEAIDLRNRYSKNVGTVIVVFNNEQLRSALRDDSIDYILPFHRSQWRKAQYVMMGLPTNTMDYTMHQNDRIKNPKTGRAVKLAKIKHISTYTNDITGETYEIKDNIMPNQYWDYNQDGVANANRYLDYINSNKMIPKFAFLLKQDAKGNWMLPTDKDGNVTKEGKGYFKTLIDFKMYDNDGVGSPQTPVVPDFNMPYIREMLDSYMGGHESFPVANDVVEKFVSDYKKKHKRTQYSDRYAPTFYSHMGKVVDDIKQDKIGANSVVSHLKGRGVKDEEIKWSGIETFLDGKKSVTKAELQEFVAGSQLQIEEETLSDTTPEEYDKLKELWRYHFYESMSDYEFKESIQTSDAETLKNYVNKEYEDEYLSESDAKEINALIDKVYEGGVNFTAETKWKQYKIDGGKNYRELLFKMPNSSYTNDAMRVHWGDEGVLAHARIQDIMTKDGKKMLFIEEIQSDWHNSGQKHGYQDNKKRDAIAEKIYNLAQEERKLLEHLKSMPNPYDLATIVEIVEKEGQDAYARLFEERESVGKALDELRKELDKAHEESDRLDMSTPDAPFRNNYHEYVLKILLRMASEEGYDAIGWTPADIQEDRWSSDYAEGYRIEYDQDIPKFLRKYGKKWGATVGTVRTTEGYDVWSMDITDSMKQSVLYEGQVMYSDRDSEYLELAKNPEKNEARLREMVDAVAKQNGFTERLLHGTQQFGFTVPDVSKSDDKISFFATNDVYTSKTYSNTSGTRGITDKANYEDIEEMLYLNETHAESMAYDLASAISQWAGYYGFIEGDYIHKTFLEKARKLSSEDADSEMYEFIVDAIANGYDKDSYDGQEFYEWQESEEADELFTKVNETILEYINLAEFDENAENSGNYDLYANTDDFLVIEGNGKLWDALESDKLPDISGYGYRGHRDKWTTRSVSKYAKDNGYRGVVFKNIVDDGGKGFDRLTKPANVYTFFYPQEQVKSADLVTYDDDGNIIPLSERFKKDNVDIRFSDRIDDSVYDVMGENEALKKLNKILTEDVQRLRERVKLEGTVTNSKVFDANQLHSVAVYLNKSVNSAYNSKQLAKDLERLYSYIAQSKDIDEQSLFAKCNEIARNILAEQRGEKVVDDYYKGILDDLRSRRISLSEEQIKEVQSQYGDRYRNAFMGKIMITKDGVSLDSVWQELSQMYPEVFDAETTEADQPLVLLEIYDSARESSVIYQKYMDAETTMGLATEIYNKYWTAPRVTTVADKYTAEIKKLNFEHRKAMSDLRTDFNDRLQKQKTADAIHYGKIINNLRQREHSRVQEAREFGRRRVSEVKDRAERNAKIRSITDKALTLNKWLLKNSKDEHIAEPLKKPVAYLLDAINFSSNQLLGMRGDSNAYSPTQKDISLSQALEEVHEMARGIKTAQIGKDDISAIYGTFADFPVGFADDVSTLSKEVNHIMRTVGDNEFVLNQMSLDSLKELDKIVTTIKSTVTKMNKFLAVRHAQGVANLSQTDIQYLDSLGKGKVEGRLKKMLNWGNALPYYAFKRFGEGGQKVYEALMDGWDKFAFHTKQIIDYAESVYTADEIKKWESDIKTFDVLEPSNDADFDDPNYRPTYQKIQMTVPQIMSLYCLQKREQAKDHLKGGGIRIADIEVKQGAKKDVISQSEGVIFAESEIETIINSLTSRQREVADKLQEFMNTVCTDWGNEVSMLRFGYKAFGEENYFPIQSDENNLAVNDETENNNRLFRLLNMSFTKSTTKKANNRIVISNIFDVFAQHTSDMAKYNALALPVLDSFKWYNYKEKIKQGETQHKTKSLKQSLENAYGKNAQNYITTFLRDINGSDNSSRDTVGKHFFTNAKIASVGMNLRVALLQPTSYLRASAVIDTKYLIRAMGHKPKIARAEKYCGIAQWKALGFYDTNIQRGVTELIKHTETVKDKAVEVSLKGAEWGDKVTWGYLWNACELEIRETRKDLKVGSDEFNNAIGKRLREIIYATQVVDSTMTRSQMMRSSDWRDKTLTAFASEPTLSYNMMQDAIFECKLAKRRGEGESEMRGHRRHFVRVAFAYTVTNMMCALVESGFDAFRDDEEEEMDLATFMKMYLKNFATDMSFIAKVPYLKDAISILQGYSSNRTDTQWMSSFYYAGTGLIKNFQGKGNAYTTFKNFMKGFSYVSGLSFYNAWRDSISLLNKTEILTVDELEDAFNEMFGIEK